jgi:diadenosine tetraphosphatase ApaH/serine/threonine PP2A family protein phosphatase
MPVECLDCLAALEMPAAFIQGNGEREVLAVRAGDEPATVPEAYRPALQWVARQLRPAHVRQIAVWPQTVTVGVGGIGEVLFCHATPRSDTELFTRLTPDARVIAALGGISVSTVVCGHTHMAFERRIGSLRVLNAGSVGMPFGTPGAHWLRLGPGDAEFRHTAYDLDAAAARIRATAYPQAADFAANNVLSPPPEDRMLELFTRAAGG